MRNRRESTLLGLALLGVVITSACGGDAQSASDDESTRVAAAARAPAAPAYPTRSAEPSTSTEAPRAAEPAPAAAPARRPVIRPARPAETPPDISAGEPATSLPPAPEPEPAVRSLAAGRELELRMETALSTETNQAGDVFYATVNEDILGSSGEVLLPLGSRVKGRVVESVESPGADQPAVLTLAVESVTVNDAVRPLQATVVDLEVQADARDSNSATATKVGAAAAAGAILGRILGNDRKDAVKGAVVGAAAGAAVAAATRDGQATIAEGARLVIRLDDLLVVEAR